MKNNILFWILLVILLLGSGYGLYLAAKDQGLFMSRGVQSPTNFEECSHLKDSIIQESYPATCVTKAGLRFTQVVASPSPDPTAGCKPGGCNGEICIEETAEGPATACVVLPEHACYANATCERQASGACGWTETVELKTCLAVR